MLSKYLSLILLCSLLIYSCNNSEKNKKAIEKTSIISKSLQTNTTSNSVPQKEKPETQEAEYKLHLLKKGETLWGLAEKEYGEAHYSTIIETYNQIKNVTSLKKGDTIYIPNLSLLFKNNDQVSSIVDTILKARTLFVNHEPILLKKNSLAHTPKSSSYNYLEFSSLVSNDLNDAHLLIEQSIISLQNINTENLSSPTKMINQLKQVSGLLKSLSEGKCDENGYDINMVHQRLVYALNNGLYWLNHEN